MRKVLPVLFLVLLVSVEAFAGIEGSGRRLFDAAKEIFQPIATGMVLFTLWKAYSDDHNKGKWLIGTGVSGAIALWDQTIEFIKRLIGG